MPDRWIFCVLKTNDISLFPWRLTRNNLHSFHLKFYCSLIESFHVFKKTENFHPVLLPLKTKACKTKNWPLKLTQLTQLTHWRKSAEKCHWNKSSAGPNWSRAPASQNHCKTKTKNSNFQDFKKFDVVSRFGTQVILPFICYRSKNSKDFVENCNLKRCGRRSQHICISKSVRYFF